MNKQNCTHQLTSCSTECLTVWDWRLALPIMNYQPPRTVTIDVHMQVIIAILLAGKKRASSHNTFEFS